MQRFLSITALALSSALAAQGTEVKIVGPERADEPDVKVPANDPPKQVAPGVWRLPAAPGTIEVPEFKQPEDPNGFQPGGFEDDTLVLFDEPGDGALWAGNPLYYKARFDRAGATFMPYLGPDVPQHYPVHFALNDVSIGGTRVGFRRNVDPVRAGDSVSFPRGALVERYDLSGRDMEQMFVFDALPNRGEIVVRIDAATSLGFQPAAEGSFVFRNEHGAVTYSKAFAFDAARRRVELQTRYDAGVIEIRVPASFVGDASLPLTIDPLIGSGESTVQTSAQIVAGYPDVTFDRSSGRYRVVWEQRFNLTDYDVYSRVYDASLNSVIGASAVVDFTTDCWRLPKCANNNLNNRDLVVAQESANCASPWQISGRMFDGGSHTSGNQFVIQAPGTPTRDQIRPDVGGDPILAGPTYFTVVWERVFTATDHDIHSRQVTATSLNPSVRALVLVDNATSNELNPSISKSDGNGSFSTQRWFVGYTRVFTAVDDDIRGANLIWSGTLNPPANYSVDFRTNDSNDATVSSPTDGFSSSTRRYAMYAYHDRPRSGAPNTYDILATVFDDTGSQRSVSGVNLTNLSTTSATIRAYQQLRPSADSDGCRFMVAHEENFRTNLPGDDWDVVYGTFDFTPGAGIGGAISAAEGRTNPGYSTTNEQVVEVCAAGQGGPTSGSDTGIVRRLYLGAWRDDRGASDPAIEAQLYDGRSPGGGYSTLPGGCGGLTLTAAGFPAIGEAVSYTVSGPGAIKGTIFGFPMAGPPCGGCSLRVNGFTTTNPLAFTIPCSAALVGAGPFAVQGFSLGAGAPCLGSIRMTDGLQFTVR